MTSPKVDIQSLQSLIVEKVSLGMADEQIADEILAGLGKQGRRGLAKERLEVERREREEGIRYYEPYATPPHYQMDFHKSTKKRRLVLKTNRAGGTTALVAEFIWWATGTHPYRETPKPPVRLRICCTDFKNGIEKILIPQFKEMVKREDLLGGSWETAYSKDLRTLSFSNRSFLEMMCFTGEQSILMADGTWQFIRDLKVGDRLQNQNGLARVLKMFKYLCAPLLKITTWGGNVLVSTPNHRHKLEDGSLCRTDQLKVGSILQRVKPKVRHVERRPDWEVGWTAIMIGDGCLRGKTPFFTVSKKKSELLKNLPSFPPTCHLIKRGGNLRADNYFIATSKNKGNPLKASLVKSDLWNKKSKEKKIPEWVFKLPVAQLKTFLRYLWSTDGCVGERQASYSTVSSQLAEDVKHLLWRLDIVASATLVYGKGGFSPNGVSFYQVRVSADYNKFCKQVGKIGVSISFLERSGAKYDPGRIRKIEHHYQTPVFCVETDNGHLLVADGILTSNSYDQEVDKFGGVERDLIGEDEPPPSNIHEENTARLVKDGELIVDFTPANLGAHTSWLVDLWLKVSANQEPKWDLFFFDIRNNVKAYTKEQVEDFINSFTDEQERMARAFGKFPQFAGLVFKNFSRAKHVVKWFPPSRDYTRYIAIDPHEREKTAILFMFVNPEGDIYVYDEIFEVGTGKVLVDLIKAKIGKDKIEVVWMDAYGKNKDNFKQSSIWQEFVDPDRDGSDRGIFSITVRFTEELKQRGLRIIKDRLGLDAVYQKPKLFFMDNCPQTIHEFETAIYDDYKLRSEKPLKETIRKKGIHFIDCLMMALVNNPIYVKLRSPKDDQYRSPYAYLNRSGR